MSHRNVGPRRRDIRRILLYIAWLCIIRVFYFRFRRCIHCLIVRFSATNTLKQHLDYSLTFSGGIVWLS